jgi:hypothetical protein
MFYALNATFLFAQVDMVPLRASYHATNIYDFLKDMRVKGMISNFRDDNINLSRVEVLRLLDEIDTHQFELSTTERQLVSRFRRTFVNPEEDAENYTFFFGGDVKQADYFSKLFGDKEKTLFYKRRGNDNAFIEAFCNADYTNIFAPNSGSNATTYQGGFRFRGSVFDHVGYNLTFIKGINAGNRATAPLSRPELLYTFKFIEASDVVSSIDFTEGYVRYYAKPNDISEVSLQLGREKITYGLGYGTRLVLSGNHPDLDFIKFNVNYGIVSFSTIHASTVGVFKPQPIDRYTKYIGFQRLKFAIPHLFDIGIGAMVVYSNRGVDFAYLNPFQFYKFAEQSLQDRDNGLMVFDIQTHLFKNIEFQATFLMDESPDFAQPDLERNKYGYQVGMYCYEFLGFKNLAFVLEYTRVRPFVYSHFDERNSFTSFNVPLGAPFANGDEIYARLAYNLTETFRPQLEFRKIRQGSNVLDTNGNIIQNVGSNFLLAQPISTVNTQVPFLSGERVDRFIFTMTLRFEPARNWVLEGIYSYQLSENFSKGLSNGLSFGVLRFTCEY